MNIYEIDNEIRLLVEDMMNTVDENGEVVVDTTRLDELQQEREQKLENIACYIKNLEAEAKAIKEEEANLNKRREADEKKVGYLKKLLTDSIIGAGDDKFKTVKCNVWFKPSDAVVIPDKDLLDPAYMKKKETYDPDKERIKEALEAGQEVRGAFLEHRNNIQVK